MDKIAEATLIDGRKLPYVVSQYPPRGGMKYTYFSPDRSYVIQFFNDPNTTKDVNMRTRVEAIIGKYNPTKAQEDGGAIGNDSNIAQYFSKRFCWPTAIVKEPEFGVVCPAYPREFFFTYLSSDQLELSGRDKRSNWFTSRNRQYLNDCELGNFRTMFMACILLARSVRRMHQAGLCHSDLSCNNVLIDPVTGNCVIIDIDSLVVPGLFPPEVIGTRGYIAPEVLASVKLPYNHPDRRQPSTHTDVHALGVLMYEYLFLRHPLIGPKVYSQDSPEEDDFLALGEKATFIENPVDMSNRPNHLVATIQDLGPGLNKLFTRTFVDGLHDPDERPTAMEWERGLVASWDLIHPCGDADCEQGWFVFYDTNKPICPYCKSKIKDKEIVRFKLKTESRGRPGQWLDAGEINIIHNKPLFKWHMYAGVFSDEKADNTLQAYVYNYKGQWLLINHHINNLVSQNGTMVPIGRAIVLKDGLIFKVSSGNRGMLIEVVIKANP